MKSNLPNKKFLKTENVILLLFAIGLFFLLFQHFFKNDKVAYVDSAKIFNEYKGAEVARKTFGLKAQQWRSNIDTLTIEAQQLIKDYEKNTSKMTSTEEKLRRQIISNKQKELANYQRAIQENSNQEELKMNQELAAQINEFLLRYGKKHNYKLILIASQAGTIAYAREGLDITKDILEGLNKEYLKDKND